MNYTGLYRGYKGFMKGLYKGSRVHDPQNKLVVEIMNKDNGACRKYLLRKDDYIIGLIASKLVARNYK